MALQSFPNLLGVPIFPWSHLVGTVTAFSSVATANATGESITFIGQIYLEGGSGSKTISSSGGAIYWRSGTSVVFSNGSTNLRIGIQDVGATGLEDGTFDVYANLVGGTDTIASSTAYRTLMESGSKTLNHGDWVAISFELTGRGGSDAITVTSSGFTSVSPYGTYDTGSGPTKTNVLPNVAIEFDDGTLGWLYGSGFVEQFGTLAFNSGTTPDEYALVFQLPIKAQISGAMIGMTGIAATEDFEIILYSDPLGTPTAQRTITVDSDKTSVTAGSQTFGVKFPFSSPYELQANTDYAIAVRPTTANSFSLYANTFDSNANLRKMTLLGTNWALGERTNQTGAFSLTDAYLPLIGFTLNQLDDGASTGGFTGIIGGV